MTNIEFDRDVGLRIMIGEAAVATIGHLRPVVADTNWRAAGIRSPCCKSCSYAS